VVDWKVRLRGYTTLVTASPDPCLATPVRSLMMPSFSRRKHLVGLLAVAALGASFLLGCSRTSNGAGEVSSTYSGRWTPLKMGTMPEIRSGSSMAYDDATKDVVLFGGARTGYSNVTWTWNGRTWTKRHPATSPPPAAGAAMAYNARTKTVVLFGGVGTGFEAGVSKPFDDTWTWNGEDWRQQHPRVSPPRAHNYVLSLDPSSGDDVLFGGCTTTRCDHETWEWNGHTWRELHPVHSPPPTVNETLTASGEQGPLVLYGGMLGRIGFTGSSGFSGDPMR
jgi:hypothetical protein